MIYLKIQRPFIKIFTFLLYIIGFIFISYSETDFEIDLRASFGSNSEIAKTDYYLLTADLKFEFEFLDKFECELELETDRFEVEVEEITFKWKYSPYIYFLLGKFENALTLEEFIPTYKRPFATMSIVSDYVDELGYINSNFGFKAYKNYRKNIIPISYLAEGLFNSSDIEPQFDIGFFYHFNGEKSYLGLLGSYMPFITHELWLEEDAETQTHNFLIDLIFADHERKVIYGTEFTIGSNLINPVGLIHTQPDGDLSFFMGADTYVGLHLKKNRFSYIPALRVSVLFPELTVMECQELEFLAGNLLIFSEKLFLHLDAGLGINTFYQDNTLYTQLEFLWAVNFTVKT